MQIQRSFVAALAFAFALPALAEQPSETSQAHAAVPALKAPVFSIRDETPAWVGYTDASKTDKNDEEFASREDVLTELGVRLEKKADKRES